jgi:uncharacterized protein (DUF983 family)
MSTIASIHSGIREHGDRDVGLSMLRGFRCRCPRCGEGRLFRAYLKVADYCPACGEALYHHRTGDAPPYFVMLILGHVIVASLLVVEDAWHPALWVHAVIWMPMTVVLSLWLLPRVKGAIVGLQWANRMHGFGDADIGDGH